MPTLRTVLLVTIAMPPLVFASAFGRPNEWSVLGDEIVRLVRANFYDSRAAGAWADKHAGYAAAIADADQFAKRTREILAELKASHTAYYTNRDVQFYGLHAVFAVHGDEPPVEYESIGIDVTHDHFVRTVFDGGPADQAGLRRGDRILMADGRAFEPVESFRGRAGQNIKLTVQRTADGQPVTVSVRPRRIDPKKEWLEAQTRGTRVIRHGVKKVAYAPMFSCAGGEYQDALQKALDGHLADSDALVIDFRNGWGGCEPGFVNLFSRTPPEMVMTLPDGRRRSVTQGWRKPLFILINGGSKSGKEVVAYSIQKHKLGTLVGERTGGAVLGGRLFPLSESSLLYLAVSDVEVDGQRLEGRGVQPDIPVDDLLRFANGGDPQLEKALELADK